MKKFNVSVGNIINSNVLISAKESLSVYVKDDTDSAVLLKRASPAEVLIKRLVPVTILIGNLVTRIRLSLIRSGIAIGAIINSSDILVRKYRLRILSEADGFSMCDIDNMELIDLDYIEDI